MQDISSPFVDNVLISINYDENALSVDDILPGNIITNPSDNFSYYADNTSGFANILFADNTCGSQYISSSGLFAEIKFLIKNNAQGTYNLTFNTEKCSMADTMLQIITLNLQTGSISVNSRNSSTQNKVDLDNISSKKNCNFRKLRNGRNIHR